MRISDWSSDVCSSDLPLEEPQQWLQCDLAVRRLQHDASGYATVWFGVDGSWHRRFRWRQPGGRPVAQFRQRLPPNLAVGEFHDRFGSDSIGGAMAGCLYRDRKGVV